MRAFVFGFYGRGLERTCEHRAGPVVGAEVRGAVDVLQFQVVGAVVEAVEDIAANIGSSAPARTRVGVPSWLLLEKTLRIRTASGWIGGRHCRGAGNR